MMHSFVLERLFARDSEINAEATGATAKFAIRREDSGMKDFGKTKSEIPPTNPPRSNHLMQGANIDLGSIVRRYDEPRSNGRSARM
jgi:hypothetical protein